MSGTGPGAITPEAVVLQLRTAGPGSRIIARALDLLIEVVVLLLFVLVFSVGQLGTGGTVAFYFIIPLLVFCYPAIMEAAWRGRTLGKAALRLRVVTREGAPVRFRHTLIRSLFFIVDALVIGPVVGVLMLILTKDTVRVGDLVAGTIVLREGSGAEMPASTRFWPPAGYEEYARNLDITALTSADYEVIRNFLVRSPRFEPGARWTVAVEIATPVAAKVRQPVPAGVHPEAFLTCVAAAMQARQTGGHLSVPATTPPTSWPSPQTDQSGDFAAPS